MKLAKKSPVYKPTPLTEDLTKRARLLALAGDQTRIRILCFMFEYRQACVSEIAESLGMSVASISQHLQVMRDNGFFVTERMGNKVCYILKKNEFIKDLEQVVCDSQLDKRIS